MVPARIYGATDCTRLKIPRVHVGAEYTRLALGKYTCTRCNRVYSPGIYRSATNVSKRICRQKYVCTRCNSLHACPNRQSQSTYSTVDPVCRGIYHTAYHIEPRPNNGYPSPYTRPKGDDKPAHAYLAPTVGAPVRQSPRYTAQYP